MIERVYRTLGTSMNYSLISPAIILSLPVAKGIVNNTWMKLKQNIFPAVGEKILSEKGERTAAHKLEEF